MNILTYIGIAIGGLIAVGSTLKSLYLTNLNRLTVQSAKYTVS